MSEEIIHPATEQLQAFAEGSLDPAERAVTDAHVATCSACQRSVEEWRTLFSMLAALPAHEPGAGFATRVMAHVTIPDPWYVHVPARVASRLERFAPKTTRGWALATACLGLPVMLFSALMLWLYTHDYVTPGGLTAFAYERAGAFMSGVANATVTAVLESDIALFAARALAAVTSAGPGAAGALLFAIASATALSAWVLYQNVIRTTKRENHNYVSYCF